MALCFIKVDLTAQSADALVNAANSHLIHGGGLAAAVAAAGGPDLIADSAKAPFIKPGGAWATRAGNLDAACVIHAVGPVWRGGEDGEAETLASAYENSIRLAAELGCRSIVLPALSTGIFGYPLELAAPVAVDAAQRALAASPTISEATFCLFDDASLGAFADAAI
ncbi:MAG: macro domain-containing protein [Solirubrobacterales bacterium]